MLGSYYILHNYKAMNLRTEKFDITPDKSIYHKLGESNYSIPDALAELVDNSIDAASENGVEVVIVLDKNKRQIRIIDNGTGMSKESAAKSIVLAHSEKHNELGEFGLGLKSACMSLGTRFDLETTQSGSTEKYSFTYDKDEFVGSGDWNQFPIGISDAPKADHGTAITISKLKVKLYDNLVTRIKSELSNRYSPYIMHNDVVIRVGLREETAKPCVADPPEVIKDTVVEGTYTTTNGDKITYWYGLLKVGSQKVSGFNMFRRGRLIRASEKLGYKYHPSVMHIYGEIHLDHVPVTHNKREFILESGEFRDFIEKLWGDQTGDFLGTRVAGLIDEITKKAKARAGEEKADKFPLEKKETITNNLLKALNRLDDFKDLAFPSMQPAKRSAEGMESQIEQRDHGLKVAHEEPIPESSSDKRTPKKTQQRVARFIMVNGQRYRFDFFLQNLDDDRIDKETIIADDKTIQIYINTGYKGYHLTKDTSFYVIFHCSEAIAETYVSEAKQSAERIIGLRNSLLHEVASVVMEEEELQRLSKEEEVLMSVMDKKKEIEARQEMASLS